MTTGVGQWPENSACPWGAIVSPGGGSCGADQLAVTLKVGECLGTAGVGGGVGNLVLVGFLDGGTVRARSWGWGVGQTTRDGDLLDDTST